jgi:tRNA (adenine37-N6)-methyltransferase
MIAAVSRPLVSFREVTPLMVADAPGEVTYRRIGVVRSPFQRLESMPLQSVAAEGARGRIEVRADLAPGLRDLDGFCHIHVIAHLHRSVLDGLVVTPFLDDTPRGVFATRSDRRFEQP